MKYDCTGTRLMDSGEERKRRGCNCDYYKATGAVT
jgi:hypothetical protein